MKSSISSKIEGNLTSCFSFRRSQGCYEVPQGNNAVELTNEEYPWRHAFLCTNSQIESSTNGELNENKCSPSRL